MSPEKLQVLFVAKAYAQIFIEEVNAEIVSHTPQRRAEATTQLMAALEVIEQTF